LTLTNDITIKRLKLHEKLIKFKKFSNANSYKTNKTDWLFV
jgi:hypothetical protein